ncbi:uncharacterized protein K441DRAFT_53699 [Cenococcum geophilum 1.58]|uniref:uncharacterized protein n=1 Tax=Cenococcum geophilum 1.58 TaxID=794803 RepID=UPI00358EAAB2|nr:hypothetical protein K441DRAFT_53699 [Cenococcum geophilum 1.58]
MMSNKPPNDKQQPPNCQQHALHTVVGAAGDLGGRNKCIPPFFAFVPSCVQDHHFSRTKGLPRSRSYGTIHFVPKKAIQDGFCTIFSCLLLCDRARLFIRVCLAEPVDRSKRHRSQPLSGACNQPEPRTPFTCLSPFRPNCPLFPENMSVRWAQQHTFFSFRKEVPWSSALLLLSEARPRSPTFFRKWQAAKPVHAAPCAIPSTRFRSPPTFHSSLSP